MRIELTLMTQRIAKSTWLYATLMLLSCNSSTKTTYSNEHSPSGEFLITTTIESLASKGVADNQFRDGDIIGLFAVARTDASKPTPLTQQVLESAYAKNRPFKYNASTTYWSSADEGGGIKVPNQGTLFDFYAYYPYDPTLGEPTNANYLKIPLTIASDQSNPTKLNRADMLYGSGSSKAGRKDIHLIFKHILSYIRLEVNAEGVDSDNIKSAYLSKKYTNAFCDLTTGTVTRDELQTEKVDIQLHHESSKNGKHIYDAVVIPQPINSTEEEFKLTAELSGLTQSYTSRIAFGIGEFASGHSYFPTITMKVPPVRVTLDLEQLVTETKNSTPQTWSYKIINEGSKLGEVCREYVRATANAGVSGSVAADKQMIVAYPMAANGKDIDVSRGVVLAVLSDDANLDPLGTIDYTHKSGGSLSFSNESGDERATYIPGTRTTPPVEFYVYNRQVTLDPPQENSTPVTPIIRTRLVQEYLLPAGGDKCGVVKIGMNHLTQQYVKLTKYLDGTDITVIDFNKWAELATINQDTPLYAIYSNSSPAIPATPLYNGSASQNMDKIVKGWTVPQYNDNILSNYLGGDTNMGQYLRLQSANGDTKKGNNKSGLNLYPVGYISAGGAVQNSGMSSTFWVVDPTNQTLRQFHLKNTNILEYSTLAPNEGTPIRLIRKRE